MSFISAALIIWTCHSSKKRKKKRHIFWLNGEILSDTERTLENLLITHVKAQPHRTLRSTEAKQITKRWAVISSELHSNTVSKVGQTEWLFQISPPLYSFKVIIVLTFFCRNDFQGVKRYRTQLRHDSRRNDPNEYFSFRSTCAALSMVKRNVLLFVFRHFKTKLPFSLK